MSGMSDSPLAAARDLSALWAGIGVPAGRPIAGCTVSLPVLPALLQRIRDGATAARQEPEARLADCGHAGGVGASFAKSIRVSLTRVIDGATRYAQMAVTHLLPRPGAGDQVTELLRNQARLKLDRALRPIMGDGLRGVTLLPTRERHIRFLLRFSMNS